MNSLCASPRGETLTECVVIGAGVVGLAVARALAMAGREVVVLERASSFGTGVSARSSEVVHAGLYYPTGSLKARLCVEGREQLFDFCRSGGVSHRRCGKLVVATDAAQVAQLADIAAQARRNGVDDVAWLTPAQARAMEPALSCVAALWSPSTGIVDSHGLMVGLLGQAQAHGAVLAVGSTVTAGRCDAGGWVLEVHSREGGDDTVTPLATRCVVNAAGLQAVAVARTLAPLPAQHIPRPYFAKGSYFSLPGPAPFARLVYPVPEPGGLGVHLTLDLGGQARFGPDVTWLATEDADGVNHVVDAARAADFEHAVRRYWPGLREGTLQPAYAGVRPKIAPPGQDADFLVQGPAMHGLPGLVQLFGIESPGLTACLALADEVLRRLAD